MENDNRWVQERTELLAPPPDFRPDARIALARFRLRMESEPRRAPRTWLPWAIAATLGCAAVAMLPGPRALAQQLWQKLTVRRVEILQIDFADRIPKSSSLIAQPLIPPTVPVAARGAEEARLRVGYTPRLPRYGIFSGSPQLSTMSAMAFGTVLKAADLESLLRTAGVTDQPVPAQWDGARMALEISPVVFAAWNDITMMQSLPVALTLPNGFDFAAFMLAVLRGLGVPRIEAQRFAQRMKASPSFLLPIDMEDKVGIREVTLRTGPGMLLYDYDDDGKIQRRTLMWSVSDRLYMLSGGDVMSDDLAIAAANSID